jgi:predicted RND superfamily exporter protein
MNNFVVQYARWIVRWRWAVIAAMLSIGILGSAGLQFVAFFGDYRQFFSAENPELAAHDLLERTYVAADTVMFVVRPQDGSTIFTPERLAAIYDLTEQTWQIPYTIRVDSLANYQHTQADQDDLYVASLIEDPADLTADRIEFIRGVAMSEPTIAGRMISADGTTTAIVAILQMPHESSEDLQKQTAVGTEEIIERFRAAHPDLKLAVAGHVMMANTFFDVSQGDILNLFPLMFLLLALVMLFFLRSLAGSVAAIIVVLLSVGASMGSMFYFFGVELTPISAQAPTIILTVAIADSIHLLVTMVKEMARGHTRQQAVIESMRINFQPVMLTSLTTAIGFLSLNYSDAPPFRDLGNMAALGAVLALVFSITLLPALMSVMPIGKRKESNLEQKAMFGIMELVIRNPGRTMAGIIVTAVLAASLVPTLELNDKFVEFLSEEIEFRRDSDFITANLPGIYDIAFSIDSGEEGAIADPHYLNQLARFADWLEDQPEVVHVSAFSDVMKRLNKNMNGDDEAFYRVPAERELAAQYLLLYEMSLPYGLDLNNQINVAKSATRVQVTLNNISSTEMKAVKTRAEAWLHDNAPEFINPVGSGITIMFAYLTERNMIGMTTGTGLAILLISLCLVLALRSVKMGLISLLPNFLPPIIAFGIWALVKGEIGQYAAMVTAVSLGLIVDFTVHFLSKYLRARREQGMDAANGIRYAFETVGSALWISAFVLISGFMVLSFSNFLTNAYLGQFVALIIAVALVVDFLLLPAILMLVDKGVEGVAEPVVPGEDVPAAAG